MHSLLFQYRFIVLSWLKIKGRACFSRYTNKHTAYLTYTTSESCLKPRRNRFAWHHDQDQICKIKLINPDKIFTCKQNLQFAEKCTFCMTCLYLIVPKPSLTWACLFISCSPVRLVCHFSTEFKLPGHLPIYQAS